MKVLVTGATGFIGQNFTQGNFMMGIVLKYLNGRWRLSLADGSAIFEIRAERYA